MKRLVIDTSAQFCAACLFDKEQSRVLASKTLDIGRGHAEVLMDVIDTCMRSAETGYSALSETLVTIGPGSFTGLRVGMATARGFALSLDIPALGVNTLETCATFAQAEGAMPKLATLIDARRNEAYCKIGDGAPFVETYEQLAGRIDEDAVLCGTGAKMFNNVSSRSHTIVHDLAVAPIEFIAAMQVDPGGKAPEPLYLRHADAKPQKGFALERVSG